MIEEGEMNGDNLDHLEEEARLALDRNKAGRVEYIKACYPWIGYPAAQDILQRMDEIYQQPRHIEEKNHLLVTNPSEVGLRDIVIRFNEKIRESIPLEGASNPVVTVITPPYIDRYSFIDCIFDRLNLRDEGVGWVWYRQREKRIKDYMRLFQTRVLIIQEIHNINKSYGKGREQIVTQIRVWCDEWGVALIMTGYQRSAVEIVGLDEELKSRTTHIQLKALSKDVFRRFVAQWVRFMPLPHPSPVFEDKSILELLYFKSMGDIRSLRRKIRQAAIAAVLRDSKKIDYEDLQKSGLLDDTPPSSRGGQLISSPAAELKKRRLEGGL